MSACIALLRAVNVGGRASVAMSDLRGLLARLGFAEPRSLLQSGNLVFEGGDMTVAEIESRLESEVKANLGLSTDIFVRSADAWRTMIAANPLPDEARRDPAHLLAFVMRHPAKAEAVAALQKAIVGPEVVRQAAGQIYIHYPDGIGRSRLTNDFIERRLGDRGTGRNWNTVLKLAAAAGV